MKISISRAGIKPANLFVEIICKHHAQLGSHAPISFILPGGPGADHTHYLNYACLSEVSDLVFHDPRGCGQSDKGPAATYTMDNYIDDVESIRQQLALNKINIIGKSYGSMCALGYALRYPQAVNKLVLAAGAPSYRFLESAKKNLQRWGTPEQIKVCEKLWKGSFKNNEEIKHFFYLMNDLYSVKARSQTNPNPFTLTSKYEKFSYAVLNEGFRHSFWNFDYENELQRILCPTLILAGREDWVNDVKYAEWMVSRIPHSQLHVFEQTGHSLEVDAAEDYFQLIADFIKR